MGLQWPVQLALVLGFTLAVVVVGAWLAIAIDPRAPVVVLVPVIGAVRRLLWPLLTGGSEQDPPDALGSSEDG
jgi:hypothetical protein